MGASTRSKVSNEGAGDWLSLSNLMLLAGILIGTLLMLRGIGNPWNGLGDGDGALFSSIARNYIQFGVGTLQWGQLTNFEEISQPAGNYYLHHPPLFPLLVAAFFSVFGESETAARLVSILATLLTTALLYHIVRKEYGTRGGMLAVFFFLTYPSTIVFGRKPGYEALTLFFVMLAVWLYQHYRERPAALSRYLLLAAIALATATDWPAFFLPAALIVHMIVYRRNDKLDPALLTGLVLVPALILITFFWSIYTVDRAAIADLLHQGMTYMGLISPDSAIAQNVVEARITFTAKEYIFRILHNINLNFGMIPFVLSLFGLAALKQKREFRGIVLALLLVALGACLLFWRSLYFHLWWQHLLAAPLAILSAAAVMKLMASISENSAPSRSSSLGTAFLAALVAPILATTVYNVWLLQQKQTRILPVSQFESADFLPQLGERIRFQTAMGDQILTNLAPLPYQNNPYARVLPYYARRVFEPGLTNPQQVMNHLQQLKSTAGDVYFLLWRDKAHNDDGDVLSDWLSGHSNPSEFSVAGQKFRLFKLTAHSPSTTDPNQGD